MEITLTPETIGEIVTNATDVAYLPQFVNTTIDSSGRDALVEYLNFDDARIHVPGTQKTEGEDELTELPIEVKDVFKLMTFQDRYEESELVARIEAALPGVITKAIDQYPTGVLKNQDGGNIPAIITKTAQVDGTLASWVKAAADQSNDGFGRTGMILDRKAEPLLWEANTNSNSTLQTVTGGNGVQVLSAPVGYHEQFSPAGEYGYMVDRAGAFLVIQPSITLDVYSPHDDWTLRKANRVGVYAGIRLGFAVADGAARRLVAATGGTQARAAKA